MQAKAWAAWVSTVAPLWIRMRQRMSVTIGQISSRRIVPSNAALLGDGDGAPKARKTGWRMDRAVVVEGARRREGEPIGRAERIAPQRRAKLAAVPDAEVARRGMRRGSFVGPLDRRAHRNAQRGRREREVLNGDRRDRAPRHPAARGHREPRAGGELAGSAEQNERVQCRGAEHERL